jgi:hypothetical protein
MSIGYIVNAAGLGCVAVGLVLTLARHRNAHLFLACGFAFIVGAGRI